MLWGLSAIILLCLVAKGAMAQTISDIITIPLYSTATDTGANKWGIWVSLGGGTTPQLFEFDTGGGGFYATYASNSASPWWGSQIITNSIGTASNLYDSGFQYSGNTVQAQISLFSNNSINSAVAIGSYVVGQTVSIIDTKKNNDVYWSNGPVVTPPIDGAFYGDFGMDLGYNSNGLVNLIEQMHFTNGITPGFIVNTPLDGQNGYLQIGLSSYQTNQSGFNYFKMNADASAPTNTASGTSFYSQSSVNMTMSISNSATGSNYSTNIGIITDTGATPNIHNTQNATNPPFTSDWIAGDTNTHAFLSNGLTLSLTATNTQGNPVTVYSIGTLTNGNDYSNANGIVMVQDTGTTHSNMFNFNAGLYFFDNQQVTYDLSNSLIGLGPLAVPEPSTWALLGIGIGVFLLTAFRRNA